MARVLRLGGRLAVMVPTAGRARRTMAETAECRGLSVRRRPTR
jgi:hypothetical protein